MLTSFKFLFMMIIVETCILQATSMRMISMTMVPTGDKQLNECYCV